jgi:hypothetical protein
LTLVDGRAVRIPLSPDAAGAQLVLRRLRRVLRVDLQVASDRASSTVRGIGHRFPCTLPVSLETALALAIAGTPVTVDIVRTNGVAAR